MSAGPKDRQKIREAQVALVRRATLAASTAAATHLAAHGEHPFNCGFSWVSVRPARGPLVTAMKAEIAREQRQWEAEGRPGRAPGWGRWGCLHEGDGWVFWGPGDYSGLDMGVKRAGAEAFAAVLAEAGIVATVSSRLD